MAEVSSAPVRRPFHRRRKTCPFWAQTLSDRLQGRRLLQRYISERGKIVPSRITAVSQKKQPNSPRRSSAPASSACCPTSYRKAAGAPLIVDSTETSSDRGTLSSVPRSLPSAVGADRKRAGTARKSMLGQWPDGRP